MEEEKKDYREDCCVCGMIANVDPWFHAERYAHQPVVLRDGKFYRHNGRGVFDIEVDCP